MHQHSLTESVQTLNQRDMLLLKDMPYSLSKEMSLISRDLIAFIRKRDL